LKNIAIASFRADPSFWLAFFFCRSIAVLVGTAARLDWDTRLFPWAIGIPALALAVRQLLADWRSAGTNAEPGEATRYVGVLDIPVDRSIPPEEMFRHTVRNRILDSDFCLRHLVFGISDSDPTFHIFLLDLRS
jgi:putative Ca2+/H+ antiporter (TMEM165/GDT1 family)